MISFQRSGLRDSTEMQLSFVYAECIQSLLSTPDEVGAYEYAACNLCTPGESQLDYMRTSAEDLCTPAELQPALRVSGG